MLTKRNSTGVIIADVLALLESSKAGDPLNLLSPNLDLSFRLGLQLHTKLGVLPRMENLG